MWGPASLRVMRSVCQLSHDYHTSVSPQPAIQRSQHDSTCKRIPIQIQRAKPNFHHARAPHQPRAPEAQYSQAQLPLHLGYQLADNTLTILDDHGGHHGKHIYVFLQYMFILHKHCNSFWFFWFEIHTTSTPITSGTHTDGGAVIRKPGSAWLEGTPAVVIIFMFCLKIAVLK